MGKVRTGWKRTTSAKIRKAPDIVISPKSILSKQLTKPKATWVGPKFVAEIEYRRTAPRQLIQKSKPEINLCFCDQLHADVQAIRQKERAMGLKRRRFKQTDSLETRLEQFAQDMRERADGKAPGDERNACSSEHVMLIKQSTLSGNFVRITRNVQRRSGLTWLLRLKNPALAAPVARAFSTVAT
jgi:hypothetical protein